MKETPLEQVEAFWQHNGRAWKAVGQYKDKIWIAPSDTNISHTYAKFYYSYVTEPHLYHGPQKLPDALLPDYVALKLTGEVK